MKPVLGFHSFLSICRMSLRSKIRQLHSNHEHPTVSHAHEVHAIEAQRERVMRNAHQSAFQIRQAQLLHARAHLPTTQRAQLQSGRKLLLGEFHNKRLLFAMREPFDRLID